VTTSDAPEVAAVKERLAWILSRQPAPLLPAEGPPNERKPGVRDADID
jgi:hypothetical protein